MTEVKCIQCNGYYKIRDGKFGLFAGCSNYPTCKSTMKLSDFTTRYFMENGINIYAWDKICWKCRMTTKVYSYYLNYELENLYGYFGTGKIITENIGLGDFQSIDKILAKKYPTIESRYSMTTHDSYVSNGCEHCRALQGKYYVVEDPHEIMGDLMQRDGMKKYLIDSIQIEDVEEFKKEIPILFS